MEKSRHVERKSVSPSAASVMGETNSVEQQTSGAKGEVFEREIHAQKREREEDPERATAIESDKDAPPKRHRGETLGTVQSVSSSETEAKDDHMESKSNHVREGETEDSDAINKEKNEEKLQYADNKVEAKSKGTPSESVTTSACEGVQTTNAGVTSIMHENNESLDQSEKEKNLGKHQQGKDEGKSDLIASKDTSKNMTSGTGPSLGFGAFASRSAPFKSATALTEKADAASEKVTKDWAVDGSESLTPEKGDFVVRKKEVQKPDMECMLSGCRTEKN